MNTDFMRSYGVSTQEMAEAIRQANWPPISEFGICLIDVNPSLYWFQKRILKRRLRKKIKGGVKEWKRI